MQLWSPFSDVNPSREESEGCNCQSNLGLGGTFDINSPLSCRCSIQAKFVGKFGGNRLVDLRKMTRNIPVVLMFLDQILLGLKKEILAWLQP